jgi:hypothetical protein|eukprot:CAMPEP_0174285906 /NCGR_PEP_ID=MMETSP0809-20121228/9886_1 /TAXON_ID=73025 ORGANISM="Eutreptiella gymnastica-like, Strain CCMP1594" /NCGR_SAMPLE_ID=MMETSP0809 /ASSEMBLY_ACC=CAM_ASM_000658 /LENGTH=421 /DNA_ID=CAMNT_0015381795 /DNA_START=31 /DNA_END=1296 /DNA_ORIENTATION=+
MAGYQTINVFGHEVQHAQSSNVKQTIALAIASVAVGAATIAGWNVLSTTTPKEQLWTTTSGVIKPAPVIGLGQTSRPHASRVPVQASAGQSWTADELQAMPDTYQHKAPTSRLAMFGGLGAIAAAGVAFLFGYRGNAATKEIAMMAATADQGQDVDYEAMIRDMRQTYDTNPKQLQVQVAQAMPVLKAPFFQKVEQMANAATDEVEKAKIVAFGDAVLNNMKEIVGVAQGKMNEQSTMIQGLIGICAEEDGTFSLPLSAEKTARLREVMRKDLSAMSNDIFVNASLALMAKSAQDVQEANKEGNTENEERARNMISILQKILQTYASESLLIMCPFIADASPENVMVWNMLLNAEFEQWEGIIESEFYGGEPKDVESFSQMLDGGVGAVVFEQAKGAVQQVLAQYVFQIIEKVDNVKARKA